MTWVQTLIRQRVLPIDVLSVNLSSLTCDEPDSTDNVCVNCQILQMTSKIQQEKIWRPMKYLNSFPVTGIVYIVEYHNMSSRYRVKPPNKIPRVTIAAFGTITDTGNVSINTRIMEINTTASDL